MSTGRTPSPSSEGKCILKSSNAGAMRGIDIGQSLKKPCDLQPGFTSAPESITTEEGTTISQQQIKRPLNRRKRRRRCSLSENPSTGTLSNQNGKRRRGPGGNHRRHASSSRIILPTNFLLGGNITDPLNLNSMMDEKINRALNAVTPSSSPLPPRNSVIDIITPHDVTDPLGLNSSTNFVEPPSTGRLARNRNKRNRRRKSQTVRSQDAPNPTDTARNDEQKDNKSDEFLERNSPVADLSRSSVHHAKPSPPRDLVVPISSTQAHIRDPIVSPALPQDTRRSKSHASAKQRRRKHGKHATNDAGIQTESTEILADKLRCGSEKITHRNYFSPVKRRRTHSENLSSSCWSDKECGKGLISSFFHSDIVPVEQADTDKDLENILVKPIGSSLPSFKEDTGGSPAQNYMNSEKMSPSKPLTNVIQLENKQIDEPLPSKPETEKCSAASVPSPLSTNSTRSKKPYNARFQYGNYTQYYGYRNQEKFKDIRMECLKKEWFKDKDVLDVGCNAGHLTLLIARDYQPRKIVGIDIDDNLIRIARNNIRHYASNSKSGKSLSKFPASMAITMGPLATPPVETGKDDTTAAFPNNVNFFQGNYVPKKDEFLRFQEPEYDVILCMSVSKWVHLNWGDGGLLRLFQRAFKQLRAGGMFILEPQPWSSYAAKRKMCGQLNENYGTLKIRPDSFPNTLTREIGFARVEHLKLQEKNNSKGFRRPIQVYYKPE